MAASVAAAVPPVRPRGTLLRVLGVAFGISVIVGNSIAAGILRTPGEVAARLPTPVAFLAVWFAGGLYALLGVMSLAELGVLIPRSGGQYVYARAAFGPFAGFVIGWSDWMSTCASVAAVVMVIAEYAADLAPVLRPATTFVALAIVAVFTVLQWQGIKWGDITQQITSLVKTLAFAALIIACFLYAGAGHAPTGATMPAPPALPLGAALLPAIVVAMQSVIYTYDGWNGVLYFSEEVRDPARDIPRSMFGGVWAVIVIYMLVNLAFLEVLGIGGLAGNTFAAGAAARAIWGETGDVMIHVLMIVSLLSGANAILLMASRTPYAMSRDGLLVAAASRVNAGGTPTATLGASAVVCGVMIATGTFSVVIAIAAFFFVLNYVTSFAAVFALRRQRPDAPRGYRARGYPVTTAISFAGGVAFLVGTLVSDTRNSLIAVGLLVASYPLFRVTARG